MAWYRELGEAIHDGGNAFGGATTMNADGIRTHGSPSDLTGYVIINATDTDHAEQLAAGCPALQIPTGRVEVHEALVD